VGRKPVNPVGGHADAILVRSAGESTSAARAASVAFAVTGTVPVLSAFAGRAHFERHGADPDGLPSVGVVAIVFALVV